MHVVHVVQSAVSVSISQLVALSVCHSVRDVDVPWAYRLNYGKVNYMNK